MKLTLEDYKEALENLVDAVNHANPSELKETAAYKIAAGMIEQDNESSNITIDPLGFNLLETEV